MDCAQPTPPLEEVPPTYCQDYNSCPATFLSFMAAVNTVFRQECLRGNAEGYPNNQRDLQTEYDFIVVGGGTAGSVVAARLSEVTGWSVLLIEAGGDARPDSNIPAISNVLWGTPFDWQYRTIPQKEACLASAGRKCGLPKGKSLGGTSTINGMTYLRGNRMDFDDWARMGNPGWSYEEVLPYFKKSEDNKNPEFARTRYHGKGGYIPVQSFPYKHPLVDTLIAAGNELGIPERDLNGEYQIGVMNEQSTQYNGSRYSTSRSFLHRVRCRPNLHIAKCSYAMKVIFRVGTNIAHGVEFMRFNRTQRIYARREIILSAGVINSPQLLMLSGIGPKAHLQEMGIRVVKDLKVGHNLQDQFRLLKGVQVTTDLPAIEVETEENYRKYREAREGPLAGRGVPQVPLFAKVLIETGPSDVPDIQLFFTPLGGQDSNYKMGQGGSTDTSNTNEGVQIQPINLVVKSIGIVQLKSKNPFEYPLIDPKYLFHPDDIKLLLASIRFSEKFINTSAMRSVGAKLNTTALPGCTQYEFGSDDYWVCILRQYSGTSCHTVGTCKMGPASDKDAVVDRKLKVHGVRNLRVIDASIMPVVVRGNTQAATIMIGEKGADMIKKSWIV